MPTRRELAEQVDDALLARAPIDALRGLVSLVRSAPHDFESRLRIGDALAALGRLPQAAQVFALVLAEASAAGHPLLAIVALKALEALDPAARALLRSFATRYAAGSAALGRAARLGLPDPSAPVPSEAWVPVAWSDAQVCDAAAALAASREGLPPWPGVVPSIPLLSELPPEAFANILGAVRRRSLASGEVVVREGDPGDAFFLLARGRVRVTRGSAALATLEEGAIFGEMALLSAAPRAATVTASEASEVLVFGRDALTAAAQGLPVIAAALERFMRQRLVKRLLDTHAMFEPFDAGQRLQLGSRFEAMAVTAGQVLLHEGEAGGGLHVVLHGSVSVTRETPQGPALLAELGPGEVFGEISMLEGVPVTATVTAGAGAMVLVLPSQVFLRLVEGVPGWRRYFEALAEDRRMDQRLSFPPVSAASGWY